MKDFRAHAQRFAEFRGSGRNNHEFLKIDIIVRVRAAINDVHHGDGQDVCLLAAEVSVQRYPLTVGCGTRRGHRNRQESIGAQI